METATLNKHLIGFERNDGTGDFSRLDKSGSREWDSLLGSAVLPDDH